MKKYYVTAEWIVRAEVEVVAGSPEEASAKASKEPMPDGEVAKGTLEIVNVEESSEESH